MKIKYELTQQELKMALALQGVKVKPSYCHDDYMFTSFSMPYDVKAKLDKLCKTLGVTRSSLVRHLIVNADKVLLKTTW